ncbi:glycoside hydrolase family 2 TIM barrel-domain containing protein [Pontiella sulfatireligans]|uniref:Beta-galactosidase BoGH2A n=1 Tax=Pontiella sulfatireligans TaxID=2750658 RepID=A0A6C2UMY0_9BACT|nr:glycoside hydrolase family 2 TIM barrel-domain containing protein [Pontiella sulfatireligans]VGO20446.1 Beta-galactosidase BoGH2A [Pontiella sulfatireligans]
MVKFKNIRKVTLLSVAGIGLAGATIARERINFDEDWTFHLGDVPGAEASGFKDGEWRSLALPHDWSVEAEFSQDNAGRNAWLPGGTGWYRKEFLVPAEYSGKHVELQFDGVYRHAEVWVNGKSLGVQYDGYTSFYCDITKHLRFGEENTIAVRVDNSDVPNCRWYSGSGIYRHVWLTKTDPLHVANWGTYITTPEVSGDKAVVNIRTEIENSGRKAGFELETTLFNGSGKEVAKITTKAMVSKSKTVEQTATIKSPELWSVDAPNLYSAISRVKAGGKVVDEYRSTFGIRTLRFDAEKGFFLNGQNMKMKGVCLHHEMGTVGAAVPVRMWERRLAALKDLGCNAIRTAHNPMAPEFMDLCDRMGFLVMDEFVDKWEHQIRPNADPLNDPAFAEPHFPQEWEKNFTGTIRRDRNHPSVIIWSVGNENHPAGSDKQNEGLERYCNFVRSMDPTRPVISGMERGKDMKPEWKVNDILKSCAHMDLIGMNYGEQWVKRIGQRNPGKPFVSTESYVYFNSSETKRFALIEKSPWIDVLESDHNMGLFLWVGARYLGEVSKKKAWPRIHGGSSALLDMASFKTINGSMYEAFWSEQPVVSLAVYDGAPGERKGFSGWGSPERKRHWNLTADEKVDLVSYTNCDSVELYLNGRKLGTQKLSDFPNWIMNWRKITYEPGTLRAVGIRDGKAVCEDRLITAGAPVSIQLTADAETVASKGVVHVEVRLYDKLGNRVNHEEVELEFSVEGGMILGLDNGVMTAESSFLEKKVRQTNEGRCLCIVRAGESTGKLKLTVKAKGLSSSAVVVDVE